LIPSEILSSGNSKYNEYLYYDLTKRKWMASKSSKANRKFLNVHLRVLRLDLLKAGRSSSHLSHFDMFSHDRFPPSMNSSMSLASFIRDPFIDWIFFFIPLSRVNTIRCISLSKIVRFAQLNKSARFINPMKGFRGNLNAHISRSLRCILFPDQIWLNDDRCEFPLCSFSIRTREI
jgi:hypothetical protein